MWCILHQGFYHPKKPEKIQVVFNCSAEFQGHSLNRHFLQGPDLTNSLVGVLCRFRQGKVVVACDIEGMFHQVRVNEEHCSYLRFLWCDKSDTTKVPEEYRIQVHLFGATSSPGCANLALRQAAQDGESVHGAEAATFVKENFDIDDGVVSTATNESAISLVKKGKELCRSGGFHLHKFTFLLRGRRILQLLCKEAIDWDDPIPETMQAQWQRWVRELPLPEKMRISRCYKPSEMRDIKKVELRHFSDASTEGYGQCTYLRLTDVNDLLHCSLVMGKARVAPLKQVTIPRITLTLTDSRTYVRES